MLVATKKGTISQGCKACGFHGPLEVHHKVNTFIIKNPPSTNPGIIGSSLTEGKRSKRSKKGENGDSANNSSANLASDANNTSSSTLDLVVPKAVVEEEDDTTWSTDLSEEAVRARMADLTEGAKTMTISDDAEKSEKDRIDIFYNLVKLRRDGNELENVQVHKELAVEADRLDITFKAPLVLAELLFSHNIINEIRKHRNLLLRFTHNSLKAQRYLLGGIEQIIALHAEKLLDKVSWILLKHIKYIDQHICIIQVAGVLKLFYDNDILEEKTLLEWGAKASKKYVSKELSEKIHEKAKPFINWLQEAEEEESTDDDDSDVEIEYNDRARVDGLKVKEVVVVKKSAPADDDDEDDIDIDDI